MHLVPPKTPGIYHCVQRCVRRAFLCGEDTYSGISYEHRKVWVEGRIKQLSESFAVSIWSYAVMSNHLHLIVQLQPEAARRWSDVEVARRWVAVFPAGDAYRCRLKEQALLSSPPCINRCRERLSSLSWLMRCLAEPIARMANREDGCTGRFWQGRFKSQALLNDRALLAVMAYVDLNPIRAGISQDLPDCTHTSLTHRLHKTDHAHLQPALGLMGGALSISNRSYIELVQWTGRQIRPGKHSISNAVPKSIQKTGIKPGRWLVQVKGIGSGYYRAIGTAQELIDKAEQMQQRWLKGIGFARKFEKA